LPLYHARAQRQEHNQRHAAGAAEGPAFHAARTRGIREFHQQQNAHIPPDYDKNESDAKRQTPPRREPRAAIDKGGHDQPDGQDGQRDALNGQPRLRIQIGTERHSGRRQVAALQTRTDQFQTAGAVAEMAKANPNGSDGQDGRQDCQNGDVQWIRHPFGPSETTTYTKNFRCTPFVMSKLNIPAIAARLDLIDREFISATPIDQEAIDQLAVIRSQCSSAARTIVEKLSPETDVGRTIAMLDTFMHVKQVGYDAVLLGVELESRKRKAAGSGG